MKKLMTIAALILAVSAFALDAVTLDGNFNVKKAKATFALFEGIDWTETEVGSIDDGVFENGSLPLKTYLQKQDENKIAEGKGKDANYVNDWDVMQQESDEMFKKCWNGTFKKGLQLTRNASEARYRLHVVAKGLDFGSYAASIFAWGNAGGAIIIGTVLLTDINTGEVVELFKLNHVQGSPSATERMRLMALMAQIVNEIEDVY